MSVIFFSSWFAGKGPAVKQLPPELGVNLIAAGGVFQCVFLTHREVVHIFHIKNANQVGVAAEHYAEEIPGFAFHPVCAGEQVGGGGHYWVCRREKYLDAYAGIGFKAVHHIYHAELGPGAVGVMHPAHGSKKSEPELGMVAQVFQHFENFLAGSGEREQVIGLMHVGYKIAETGAEVGCYGLVL